MFQPKLLTMSVLAAVSTVLSGCVAVTGIPEHGRNQFVTEFYAYVISYEEGEFDSHVDEAVLVGASHGAIANLGYRGDVLEGAIWGGLIAGVVTAIFEGDNTAYIYELEAVDGDLVSVATDYYAARPGDCVKVTVAGDVQINRVSSYRCEGSNW